MTRKIRISSPTKPPAEPVGRDQQVVRYLLDQVGRGAILPGDRISEKKIATELGFSTGPVREGLLSLVPLGLLRKRARRQWEAVALTAQQWEHLMELRVLVEEHCLKKLFQGAGARTHQSVVEDFLRLTRKLRNATVIDRNELRELDTKFHQWLLDSADNPLLSERHRFIYMLVEFQMRNTRFTEERARLGLDQHLAIMNAIRMEDSTVAILALREHLATALETLKIISNRSPN